jgi:hypothetical protein
MLSSTGAKGMRKNIIFGWMLMDPFGLESRFLKGEFQSSKDIQGQKVSWD